MRLWIVIGAIFSATSCFAEGIKQEINFNPGESSAAVSGSVLRGDRDMFTMSSARAQYLVVSLTSADRNAVFDLWEPAYKVGPDDEVKGNRMAIETTEFSGQLPATGRYLIVVRGTSGTIDYQLTAALTDPYGVTRSTAIQLGTPSPPRP